MAEIFDFYVEDNRTIKFKLSEPIMLEDNGVSDWRFHIPNTVNGLDATGWAWWLVYVNAKNEKYTIPLTLEYDYDRPDAYSIATYTVDYGMSCKAGTITFSLEAIDAEVGGEILHEWHTKTYSSVKVENTLQGNQVEYAETESDIISALLIEVRNKVNQLVGGATPLPVSSVSEMLDTDKLYLLTTDGEWYFHNGTAWVSGGVYGAGVVDSVPTHGSVNAVSSGGVYSALADNNVRLEGLESVVGQTKTITPAWIDGRSINPNTGGTNASEISSRTQDISCEGFARLRITMPLYATFVNTRGLAFYSVLPSTEPIGTANFISGIRANYDTALSADSYEVREISIPPNAKCFRTTWYASSEEQFSTEFICELIKDGTLGITIDNINHELTVVSDNAFDKTALVLGKFIGLNGNIGTSESYAYTDYIAVKSGNVVKGYSAKNSELTFRYVCAYNKDKAPISASGAENTKSYTVPDGIAYVRITGSVRSDAAGINSATVRITLNGIDSKYQLYKNGSVSDFAQSLYTATQLLTGYPLTTLSPYILKSLAYKPLGVLSKGYVCLVSDDGGAELATYTIPMLESKGNVPCTFAVMQRSEVFQSQSGIDAVVNAVTNHNCNIAQHGVQLWDTYDEYTFNVFLDEELSYFNSIGLTPYGAVCPQHAITDIVKAVAGGRLGCVRTGYNNADMYYGTYQNGPRSNIYALSSQSSLDGSLADQTVALDACKANKWLRIIHWHENELTSEKKAILEGIIDYVLADNELTFVTMKDIPSII